MIDFLQLLTESFVHSSKSERLAGIVVGYWNLLISAISGEYQSLATATSLVLHHCIKSLESYFFIWVIDTRAWIIIGWFPTSFQTHGFTFIFLCHSLINVISADRRRSTFSHNTRSLRELGNVQALHSVFLVSEFQIIGARTWVPIQWSGLRFSSNYASSTSLAKIQQRLLIHGWPRRNIIVL